MDSFNNGKTPKIKAGKSNNNSSQKETLSFSDVCENEPDIEVSKTLPKSSVSHKQKNQSIVANAQTVSVEEEIAQSKTLPVQGIGETKPLNLAEQDISHNIIMAADKSMEMGTSLHTNEHCQSNRYKVQKEVGRGGMGRVLLVHDDNIERDVAMKEMFTDGDSGNKNSSAAKRFLREARLSGCLGHPSIIPVHDLGEHPDGTLYYTMRLIEGEAFGKALKECDTLKERLHFLPNFCDICNAIAFAHSKNIIHRDLKPDNIIIGSFGETVVLDWGLAKDLNEEESIIKPEDTKPNNESTSVKTRVGSIMGTPSYMSPEQAMGQIDKIDHRSDQYSLGVILYEILTGHIPFDVKSPHLLMLKLVSESFTPVLECTPEAPKELALIAEKALSKNPDERYKTVKELAGEITSYLSGEKVASYSYTLKELVVRFIKRHKAIVSAGFFVLFAIIAIAIIMSFAYKREAKFRREAVQAQQKAQKAQQRAQKAQRLEKKQRNRAENAYVQIKKEQRTAHYSLAQALVEKAEQKIVSKQYLDSLVFASAARLHNPVHIKSPWHSPGFGKNTMNPQTLMARANGVILLAISSTLLNYEMLVQKPRAKMHFHKTTWDIGNLRMAISVENNLLTAPYGYTDVIIYNLNSGEKKLTLKGHKSIISNAAFSSTGNILLTVDISGRAITWEIPSGKLLKSFDLPKGKATRLFKISNTSEFIWAITSGGIWIVNSQKGSTSPIEGVKTPAKSMCMNPNGKNIIMIGKSGRINLVELSTGVSTIVHDFKTKDLYRCSFSNDGRVLYVMHYLKSIITSWEYLSSNKKLNALKNFTNIKDLPISIGIDKNINRLWVGFLRGEFGFYSNLKSTKLLQLVKGFSPTHLWRSNKNLLYTMSNSGGISMWRAMGNRRKVFPPIEGRVQVVMPAPDGSAFISAGWDKILRIYPKNYGVGIPLGKPFNETIWSADWSPDNKYVAAIGNGGILRIYNPITRKLLHEFSIINGLFSTIIFSADSSVLYLFSKTFLYSFSLPSGRLIRKIPLSERSNANGGPTAQSRHRLMYMKGKEHIIVDFKSGKRRSIKLNISGKMDCAALQGDVLICQTQSQDIYLWDYPTLKQISILKGSNSTLASIRIHPNKKWVVTSTDDRTVRLWELKTGKLLLLLPFINPQFAQFSHDGKKLYFSKKSKIISIPLDLSMVQMDPQELLDKVHKLTGLCIDGIQTMSISKCTSTKNQSNK
jgi:eukaryotic-like serine/threonine-protein kinase